MKPQTIKIKEEFITKGVRNGNLALMYSYSVMSYLMSGVGHMGKSDLISKISSFTGKSEKTSRVWVNNVVGAGFATVVKSKTFGKSIRIISKDKLAKFEDAYSRKSIKFQVSHLKDYKKFRDHYICVVHRFRQSIYRFMYRKLKSNTNSLLHRGEISGVELPSSVNKVGCAISKVQEYTGLNSRTIQMALKGKTERVYNLIDKFPSYEEFKKSYDITFFKRNPKYSYKKTKKGYFLVYLSLGSISTYNVNSTENNIEIPTNL